jgi:hypothetical protein
MSSTTALRSVQTFGCLLYTTLALYAAVLKNGVWLIPGRE